VGPNVELKMIMSWDETNDTVKNVAKPFIESVKEKSGGSITVTARGPEAVPPFEQFKPVRDGVFDLLFTHASYHNEVTTLGNGFDIASGSAAVHKECGSWDAVDEAYQKVAGVKFLAPIPAGHGYRMYMSRPIDKADLTGFKIRTSSFYDPMLKALNAVPVRMAFPEVYSALEKKVIDGTAWGGVGAFQAKWQEVANYGVRPHFGETTSMIAMNLDSWKKLTPEQQTALNAAVTQTQEHARRVMKDVDADEWSKLSAAGMQVSELKGAEAQKWLDAYYTNTLQEFITNANAEFGPRIKTTLDCVQAKKS
jgi:TRAP-type C4-dicarboxylate transport system substrate-binding protein